MRLQASTPETIKAKADRYYKAQCARLAAERKALRLQQDEAHSPAPAVVVAAYKAVVARTITPSDIAPLPKRKRVTKKVKQ